MTEKTRIIKTLGEPGLLLPVLLNDGLAANDRAKYYFTLLQAAATHARHPEAQVSSLRRERLASGVDDETCDQVVAASTLAATDRICIPGAVPAMWRVRVSWRSILIFVPRSVARISW